MHNIKVEFDETNETFPCSICEFKVGNMAILKDHMIDVHKKDMWNLGLEAKSVFNCGECDIEFPMKSLLKNHIDSGHREVNSAVESDSQDDETDSDLDDLPDLYQEKDWTSGCNFKSRAAAFEKAAEGLKFLLKKSVKIRKVAGIKIKVHKVTKKKECRVSDIEIINEEGSGHVNLRVWNPNKNKKMTTVQIDKSSKGDVNHVQILTTKVVKPVLDKLLKGESVKALSKTFFQDIEVQVDQKNFECPTCGRIFRLERSMKAHITKTHIKNKVKTKSVKLKEEVVPSVPDNYHNNTEKDVLECSRCMFKTVNKTKLKKHFKKIHNMSNISVSPARKKPKMAEDLSKGIVDDILNMIHDKYETVGETDEELKKFERVSFEENRMDQQVMDTEKFLSDQNDKKILDKRKKEAQEEFLRQAELNRNESIVKKSHERPKRKREMSQKNTAQIKVAQNVKLPPGFQEIPDKLKKHFPENHVFLQVKPDGMCGVSCGSAHMFAMPQNGKQFREQINKHIVSNWTYYKDKICFPYERQVGVNGKNVVFHDPLEFQNFLQTEDADLLWTDCKEIQAMCNQYQMAAIVVKMAESKDDPPTINQVGPDKDICQLGLSNSVLIGQGNVPTMHLLLQGAHYTLAVPRASINEKYGNFSIDNDAYDEGYNAEKEEDDNPNGAPMTMEEKLTQMETKYTNLKEENIRMSKEIKTLRAEWKTKKAHKNKNEMCDETNSNTTEVETLAKTKSNGYRKTSPQSESEINLKCPVCQTLFKKENILKKHMQTHNKDGDWTCDKCSYQTYEKPNLDSHKKSAHTDPQLSQSVSVNSVGAGQQEVSDVRIPDPSQVSNRCTHCMKDFIYRIDLTKHLREAHKTYKPCRNLSDCTYAPKCRYNHKKYPEGTQVCFECGFTFTTVHDLMKHRKRNHKVPLCKAFLKNNCGFSADDCYHTHAKQPHKESLPAQHEVKKTSFPSALSAGFWDAPVNLAPPAAPTIIQQGPNQIEWSQMKEAINQLNQMMARFQ